ncbi:MAG: GNAT family protein [Bacteroidia bacterium]
MKREPGNRNPGDALRGLRQIFPGKDATRGKRQAEGPELRVDENLSIRALRPEDAERIYFLVETNRTYLQAWLSWIEQIRNIQDARNFVQTVRYRDVYDSLWVLGIWYGSKLVGLLDFNEGDRNTRTIAIGYWLAALYQGKGIVTRACARCMDYLFDEQDVEKIVLKCAVENESSRAVAQRLHFSWDSVVHDAGTVDGKTVDLIVYAMTRGEWQSYR